MRVTDNDIGAIFLTLLDELKLRPQGTVLRDTMLQAWETTGLRTGDLDTALTYCERAGLLQPKSDDGDAYTLTERGHQRMQRLNSPLTFGLASHQRLRRKTMRRLHFQRPTHAPLDRERRQVA